MKRTVLSLLTLFCVTVAVAQNSYYSSIEGLTKVELKRALHDMMQPQHTLSYGSGEGHTWQGFWQTDRMEDNQVYDRYSNEKRYFNPEDTTASITGIDIEHVWAKSWFGGSLKVTPARDLFNLLPSDYSANRSKSNNPIGVVTQNPAGFDNGSVKRGNSTVTYPGETVNVWEPADKWKGDFARIYFYMATCYWDVKDEDGNSLWGEESLRTLDGSEWPTLLSNVYSLMLQWARQDPVDSIEIKRNEAVYHIQGNRNPFIDLPSLSEYIWGTMMDSAFHADAQIIIDPIVIPVDTIETEIADFFEDFETGSKGSYAIGDVTCTASSWTMNEALIGGESERWKDHYLGKRSVRMRNGYIEMMDDYVDGCDTLSFYAGRYGDVEKEGESCLSVYYSTDEGENWLPIVESEPMGSWKQYVYDMDVKDIIRLRFVCDGGGTGGTNRINIDNICMTHYVEPEPILIGDVNGDKQVSIADVTMLVNIILGKTTEGYDTKVADVNGDKQITIADVTALVNIILGK
ncbi:MAG: endonuclease [Bacteroidaceae bacterium]|nr:endonuclease [Bacteroidaceae bacterium]